MKCPNCGAQARDGSRFCMACGVELTAEKIIDPSEAETVFAPTLSAAIEKKRAASLGPAGDLPGMSTEGQGVNIRADPPPPPAAADPPAPPPPPMTAEPTPDLPPPPDVEAQPAGIDPGAITVEPKIPSEPIPQAIIDDVFDDEPLPTPPPFPVDEPSAEQPAVTPEPTPAAGDALQAGQDTGLTDQWMALGEDGEPAQSQSYDLTATPPADEAAESAATTSGEGEADMEFDDGEGVEVKKSKTGKIIGCLLAGCLIFICCGGLAAGGFVFKPTIMSMLGMGAYEYDTTDLTSDDWSWGTLKASVDTLNVYESGSSSASVLESHAKGDTFEYYGMDDTLMYYKVKTGDGKDGYVSISEVEVSF
jgi:hypothetical protein